MAYSVGIGNKWSTDGKATKEFFEAKGCHVQESRLHGDYDVFLDHRKIAIIFNKKSDQIKHLINQGII